MQRTAQILSVSYDAALLQTRQTLLELQGYSVVSAEGFTDALKLCGESSYDLVIVGHSIPHNDKKALLQAVRKGCEAPVLALLRANESPLEGAYSSDPMDTKGFLESVRALTSRKDALA